MKSSRDRECAESSDKAKVNLVSFLISHSAGIVGLWFLASPSYKETTRFRDAAGNVPDGRGGY